MECLSLRKIYQSFKQLRRPPPRLRKLLSNRKSNNNSSNNKLARRPLWYQLVSTFSPTDLSSPPLGQTKAFR